MWDFWPQAIPILFSGGFSQFLFSLIHGLLQLSQEYEEIIAEKTTPNLAKNVVDLIVKSENVVQVNTYYHWNLITADPDDNKFVDCAFAAGATYIVSDDSHFSVLRDITFPQLLVLRLKEFLETLQKEEE